MRVRLLYFGVLKDVMGHGRTSMDVAEEMSVTELLAPHRGSGKSSVWDSIAVAVNASTM
jgi:hypothetical protein